MLHVLIIYENAHVSQRLSSHVHHFVMKNVVSTPTREELWWNQLCSNTSFIVGRCVGSLISSMLITYLHGSLSLSANSFPSKLMDSLLQSLMFLLESFSSQKGHSAKRIECISAPKLQISQPSP